MNRRFTILLEGQTYAARVQTDVEGRGVLVGLEGAGEVRTERVRVLSEEPNPLLLVGSRVVRWALQVDGHERTLSRLGTVRTARVGGARETTLASANGPSDGVVRAPMPGRIVDIAVAVGDEVEIGARLLVIEAMKMQNELLSTMAGRVEAVLVRAGDAVERGAPLVRLT